jgi:hypothetical protein
MSTDVQRIVTGIAQLNPPTLSQSVHREECTQCFDNQVGVGLVLLRDVTHR